MNRPNKTELKKYEDKLVSLRAEYDAENARLSSIIRQVETVRGEYADLCAAKERANGMLRAVLAELGETKRDQAMANRELERTLGEMSKVLAASQAAQAAADAKLRDTKGKYTVLEALIGEASRNLVKLEKECQAKAKEAGKSEAQSVKALAAAKEAGKALAVLAAKETEVRELIERKSEIYTNSEKNLRTLEHYVKRLQRIYDKQGIKIDLLSQFEIKRDRK